MLLAAGIAVRVTDVAYCYKHVQVLFQYPKRMPLLCKLLADALHVVLPAIEFLACKAGTADWR